jgi:hypothetical protein
MKMNEEKTIMTVYDIESREFFYLNENKLTVLRWTGFFAKKRTPTFNIKAVSSAMMAFKKFCQSVSYERFKEDYVGEIPGGQKVSFTVDLEGAYITQMSVYKTPLWTTATKFWESKIFFDTCGNVVSEKH